MVEQDTRLFGLTPAKWSVLASFVTVVGAFGLLFGVYTYYESVEAEKARQTLDLIREWDDGGYRTHFANLRERTLEVATENVGTDVLHDLMAAGSDADAVKREQAGLEFAEAMFATDPERIISDENAPAEPNIEVAFSEVVYFFNLLGLCVEAKVCSGKTAETFFCEPFTNFWQFFEPEIVRRGRSDRGYASGLDVLAGRFRCPDQPKV